MLNLRDLAVVDTIIAVVALVLGLLLRRLLPAERRNRGKTPIVLNALALLTALVVLALHRHGTSTALEVVSFGHRLLNALGIAGLVDLLLFDVLLGRTRLRIPSIFRDMIDAAAYIVVGMGVLKRSGVNVASLVTTSAVLTAIIGLALQGTISNLFAGLTLQLDRAFAPGDWIEVGGTVGKIVQIRWRSTEILTRDHDLVMVPNAHIMSKEVTNYSRPYPPHRERIEVGFAYRHSPNLVRRALVAAATGVPDVLADPPPTANPVEFGDSAVTYRLYYFICSAHLGDDVRIRGEVMTRVWYAAQREGLEIPFPIRTVFKTEVTAAAAAEAEAHALAARLARLAHIPIFASLAESERRALATHMRRVAYTSGEIIIRQGDPGDTLFVIDEGKVGVELNAEGIRHDVATLEGGAFFGEMSLLTGEPRTATCVARSDVAALVIDHRALERVLAESPDVAGKLSEAVGRRQAELDGDREELSAEMRARRAAETSSKLLLRIRDFFHLG